MIGYRFYLRDNNDAVPAYQEIDEPKGWDGVEFNLHRSINYEGLESVYSSEMSFYDYVFTAFTLLEIAFERDYSDANVNIKIEIYCDGVVADTIEGYLNFLTYQQEGNEINIQFEESSFARKFKNRIDTVVNLDSEIGIDGLPITTIERKTVRLHSKEIQLLTEEEYSDSFNIDTFEYESSGTLPAPTYQYQAVEEHTVDSGSGCETKSSSFYLQFGPDVQSILDTGLLSKFNIPNGISTSKNAYGKINQSGTIQIDLELEVAFYVWGLNGVDGAPLNAKRCDCADAFADQDFLLDHFDFQIEVEVGSQSQINGISTYDYSVCSENFFGDLTGKNEDYMNDVAYGGMATGFSRPFSTDETRTWGKKVRWSQLSYTAIFDNVNVDDELYIHLICNVNGSYERRLLVSKFAYVAEGYVGSNSSVSVRSVTTTDPTTVEGYQIYEALNIIAESITGQTDAIRSDYFGRTNSVPKSYGETGCEALSLVTDGKNIRNMVDRDGVKTPITSSFSELFQALNVHNNLGLRIERSGSNYYVRIEPKEYFFQRTSIFTATDPSSLLIEVAKERLWNDIEIGYNQWEIENVNGIDEPNTKHNYAIATTNIKQKLSQVTNYITGGYAIEMTRRNQYEDNPTLDWRYDDNKFIIALNRVQVTSDLYSDSEETYAIGTVSERNELFTVTDLISPETAYNLRFSPARAAINWYKTIAPALLKKADTSMKFTSGLGNINMTTELTEACAITNGVIAENQDISDSSTVFDGVERIALYAPIWISFEYPLYLSEFINIRDNSNQAITVSCGDRTYFGFLEDINYKPNLSGGIADFKLLMAYCYQGGFDDGFNGGFDISQC